MQQKLLGLFLAYLFAVVSQDIAAQAELPADLELQSGSGPPIRLVRMLHEEAAINIDGAIDEDAWSGVDIIGSLKVTEPDTLAEPPYRSDLRMFYTENGLYVSFDMEQPAESIVARFVPRDAFEINRDNVGFTLDTSGDGRYGYWMNLSLGDSEMDGTILPERQYGSDWDGVWYGATRTTDNGWSAEFFVPWSQMAMPRQEGVRRIGLYVSRKVAHLNERWGWPALPNSVPRFMSAFQRLELEGISPRQHWSLFPYASGTLDRIADDNRYKAGVDVFWRPSTNFQLTATVNPDFGAVESDNVVVNFTADETFFPEKRLFFLEGREIFSLSGRERDFGRQPVTVVNTRRIGGRPREPALPPGVSLSEREELKTAEIIAAIKATGQIGSIRYGLLAAVEDETSYVADDGLAYFQDGRDFGVFRILYEDSTGAAYRGLGWISTVTAHPESDAVVHGADFHFLSTSGRWNLNGQLLYSDRDESGAGTGVLADVAYAPQQGMKHSFEFTSLDDKIDVNDLGFQRRNDIDRYSYRYEWIKSGMQRVRDVRVSPFIRYEVNGEGYQISNTIGMSASATLNNLHTIGGFLAYLGERFDDRNSFGNGTFKIEERIFFNLNYRTDTSKNLSVFARLGYRGESVGGYSIESELGVTWRPRHNLSFDATVKRDDKDGWLLHQEDQDFTTFNADQWQPEIRVEFFPSSRQQLRVALQWVGIRAIEDEFYTLPTDSTKLVPGPKPPGPTDSFSVSQLNFQIRYRWQIAPLSDLFIVYTKGDQSSTSLMEFDDLFRDSWNNPIGDQLVIKLRYRIGS